MKRSTGILAVLLILAGAALWFDRSCRGTDDTLRARTRLYPGFDRTRIESITVNGDTFTSGPRFEAIVAELDFGHLDRRLLDFALGQPRATIIVNERGGAGRTFSLGADAPGGRGIYLQRNGESEVYVVDRKLLEVLGGD